ncbi:MAG: hypothetical protein ACUVV6_04290 [Thermoplasmatota archaeon]
MLRSKALGVMVIMVAACLSLPLGGADEVARDASENLRVDELYTVSGDEVWRSVTVASTGTLVVPRGATLTTQYIKMKDGGLEVDGGTIYLQNASAGNSVYISGRVDHLTLKNGAKIIMTAPDGINELDNSQGGSAMMDVKVTYDTFIDGAEVRAIGGTGFSNPEPWVDHQPLDGYYAAGGNGSVLISSEAGTANIKDFTVKLQGGNGGRAADGKPGTSTGGGKGGGYSNGGDVSGYIGAGGKAILKISAANVKVSGLVVVASGGSGGRAGDGGNTAATYNQNYGGGGGGGYSGGDGQAYYGPKGEDGGKVSGYVGSGGRVEIKVSGFDTEVGGVDISAIGGTGGDGGNGGWGNFYCGGGGGGYGGGGGCGGYSYPQTVEGGKGDVSERVGSGGDVNATFVGENKLKVYNTTIYAMGGSGGKAGDGGTGGEYYGGGGGGGYAGGGGGGYYYTGGSGKVTGGVGQGGNVSVSFMGGPMAVHDSTLLLFGGQGGNGGAGGKGGYYGGGGGGGYGGGGGGCWAYSGGGGGSTTVQGDVGRGGGTAIIFASESPAGTMTAKGNKFYLVSGNGGNGGTGGTAGQYSGGGGGGYGGCGGCYYYYAGGTGTVDQLIGNGGDAEFLVYHVAPSISKLNTISQLPGKPGNAKSQPGKAYSSGSGGGAGTGNSRSAPGNITQLIPMGVPLLLEPADGAVVNAIPPTFEWEHIIFSSDEGEVMSYSIQVDNNPDFSSAEIDTTLELETSFTPTMELNQGGTYYWHMMALYSLGGSYGWGPTRTFQFNTGPVLKKNIGLQTFKEDTTANRLLNLSMYFTDDLYPDQLSYSIILETDPSHILATVDGNFLSFTTPTPDWTGQERFAVRAYDPLGLSATSNAFTVRVTPVNDPPKIQEIPDIMVTEGIEHYFDLSPYITDVDSKLDSLSMTTNSTYVRVEGLGLYMTYPPGVAGELVEVNVTDELSYTTASFKVTVEEYNKAPEITVPAQPPWNIIMVEDTEYVMYLMDKAVDEETPSDKLVWNVTAVSAGNPPLFTASISDLSVLRIVPAPNAYGTGSIVLVAVDEQGKEDSRTVGIQITPVNDAPVISKMPDMRIRAGSTKELDLSMYISDVDSPVEELRLASSSPLVSVEGLKLKIFVKAETPEREEVIPLTVSDGTDTSTGEFLLRILFPPSIAQEIPDIKVKEDKSFELDLKEYSLDKDTPEAALRWEVDDVNVRYFSASIDPNTHILKITPKKPGRDEITLTVYDPDGGSKSESILVTVQAVEKKTELPAGFYMFVGFLVITSILGVLLFAVRKRA